MPDLMTIGEVARQARVATSAIRYYEQRGLLSADARHSGQRRYRAGTLRQLVFIGMMQDIGLSLDDIHAILRAPSAGEWKAIARRRIDTLDLRITELQLARTLLAGVLLCPYDHPATDREAMGNEIDRRLATPAPADRSPASGRHITAHASPTLRPRDRCAIQSRPTAPWTRQKSELHEARLPCCAVPNRQRKNRLRNLSTCNVCPRSSPVSISVGYAVPSSYSRWPK
jgi:MerR family transcriptional regulator, redox-sensitive transcriptional activator SoxR